MGQSCFGGGVIPSDDTRAPGARTARPTPPTATWPPRQVGNFNDYSREESRLRGHLDSLRNGLVCTTTEFSVLPGGVTTTARVTFSVGCNALRERELEKQQAEEEEEEEEEEEVEEEEEEEGAEVRKAEDYVLRVSLYGGPWSQRLHLGLSLRPVVGPFAWRQLLFSWREDVLAVEGCRSGELGTRMLPDAFSSEKEFCQCCLLLAYHAERSCSLHQEEGVGLEEGGGADGKVQPLSDIAYAVAVASLDAVPAVLTVPPRICQQIYGNEPPVTMEIRVWPDTHADLFGVRPRMRVKAGILFSEFVYLLRHRFELSPAHSLKLYHEHQPLLAQDQVSSRHGTVDCFVAHLHEEEEDEEEGGGGDSSCVGSPEEEGDVTLVVSLVGRDMQNVRVNLATPLRQFDALLRQRFQLQADSFLVIRSEDDFSPPYTSSNRWKLLHPFSLHDTSLGAGLRRSFRRLSGRGPPRPPVARRPSLPSRGARQGSGAVAAELDKVTRLLSSVGRSFPCEDQGERSGVPLAALYDEVPMYGMDLERCGLHPYAAVQVFEVTGPSIPVTFRVLPRGREGGPPHHAQGRSRDTLRTRQANVMDVNPAWTLPTFLQYVDAIISPASTQRRKRVSLGERSLSEWEDPLALRLGQLLDTWAPAWWQPQGDLTRRDFSPSDILLVERL